MLINKDYLKSLSPCEDRYKCYLKNYKDWSGSLEEFLDLPELTHDDKKWVFVRSIGKDNLRLVAADFAERVLHIFESKYPNDTRPRKAIEAARNGYAPADDARAYAARAAAYADSAAAYAAAATAAAVYAACADAYAARAAADAADDDARAAAAAAARAAYDSAYFATYAAACAAAAYDSADFAAYAAAYAAADARKEEEKAQIEIMKKYVREALKGIK